MDNPQVAAMVQQMLSNPEVLKQLQSNPEFLSKLTAAGGMENLTGYLKQKSSETTLTEDQMTLISAKVAGMSIKELRTSIIEAGLEHKDCINKTDLRVRATQALSKLQQAHEQAKQQNNSSSTTSKPLNPASPIEEKNSN